MSEELDLKGDENDEADIDLTATPLIDDEEEVDSDIEGPEVPISKIKDAAALGDDVDPEDLVDEEDEEDDMELLGSDDWEV